MSSSELVQRVDREKATAWLEEKWKGRKECPICGSNSWALPDVVSEVRPFMPRAWGLTAGLMPLVLVVCDNCGHTLAFNALVMGLVEHPEPEVEEAEEQPDDDEEL